MGADTKTELWLKIENSYSHLSYETIPIPPTLIRSTEVTLFRFENNNLGKKKSARKTGKTEVKILKGNPVYISKYATCDVKVPRVLKFKFSKL